MNLVIVAENAVFLQHLPVVVSMEVLVECLLCS